jgi:environmental stress-induced protein Ves
MKKTFAALLKPADFKVMPWKNGRGTTAEIAVEPAGASLDSDGLLWRLSSAKISESGEFSPFPGFDRFLTLTQGKEVTLSGAEKIRLRPGDVHHFSGDQGVNAELTAGPVADLGLIYRRGEVKAEMSVLDFTARARSFRMDSPENFFFVISGSFSASCYPGEKRFTIEPGMALRVSAKAGGQEVVVLLEPASAGAQVAAIEID